MKWIIAHSVEFSFEHAQWANENNEVYKFDSQNEAIDFLFEIGRDPDEVMIIPEMEFLTRRPHD